MATYLLTWNPTVWQPMQGWVEICAEIANGGTYREGWRTANHGIQSGDRVFISRVGKPPRGIFASGYAEGVPYLETNPDTRDENRRRVPIRITRILNPETDQILSTSDLPKFPWTPQASGILIRDNIPQALESAWSKFTMEETDALDDIKALADFPNLSETEREALSKSRIGQGEFRAALIAAWKSCALTGVKTQSMLRASHIKPWRDSNNTERLDPNNGLLLIPNLDQAFDSGLISFADDGCILISPNLPSEDKQRLGISDLLKLRSLTPQHRTYLACHRRMHRFE